MRVIGTVAELQALADRERAAGAKIALVPTMGALHAGHLSLIDEARKRADRVWVSIFVNPTQFEHAEDLSSYPRTREADLRRCREAGVDVVFAPECDEMVRPASQIWIEPGESAQPLCGRSRPGHFRAVATIVAKLLLAAKPHLAVFGEKDYQQLCVIRTWFATSDSTSRSSALQPFARPTVWRSRAATSAFIPRRAGRRSRWFAPSTLQRRRGGRRTRLGATPPAG